MLSEAGVRGFNALVALALPPVCLLCGRECEEERGLCRRCGARALAVPHVTEPGGRGVGVVLAGGAYEGIAGDLVRALKFSRHLRAADEAAALIERAITRLDPTLLESSPLLVPVPPSPLRWLARGFDSAEEMALALSKRLGLDYRPALRRAHGPRQTGRGRKQRLARPPVVGLADSDMRIAGEVLLVDDVFTTGATLTACAKPLRAAGAEKVNAVCIARARAGGSNAPPALHS